MQIIPYIDLKINKTQYFVFSVNYTHVKGGEKMARDLRIVKKDNALQIVADGNEIKDVISFSLNVKNSGEAILSLELDVIDSIQTVFDGG